MSEVEQVELLPCPFCGTPQMSIAFGWLKRLGENCFVWCSTCGASGPSSKHTKPEAIAAWNHRTAADAAHNAAIEAAAKAVWDAGGDNTEYHHGAVLALKKGDSTHG